MAACTCCAHDVVQNGAGYVSKSGTVSAKEHTGLIEACESFVHNKDLNNNVSLPTKTLCDGIIKLYKRGRESYFSICVR